MGVYVEITNADDLIDSRDVVKRIDDLEAQEAEQDGQLDDDERRELESLVALREWCSGYVSDWEYGALLIRDSYFEEYAREFAEDIGAVGNDNQWPVYCIDWKRAASELQVDYTSVEFDGVTYWVR